MPAKFGQVSNYNTLSTKVGDQTEVWQGVDFTINARLRNGLNLQGGLSTGKTHENDCDILTALPEMRNMPAIAAANLPASQRPLQYCDRQSPYLTQAKLFGVYVIPKVEVQVSGTFRSVPGQIQHAAARELRQRRAGGDQRLPGDQLDAGPAVVGQRAEYDAADPGAAPALPRPAQRARFPGRQAAALRAGIVRSSSLDIFNALNSDAIVNVNQSSNLAAGGGLASYLRPTEILNARVMKFTVTHDF